MTGCRPLTDDEIRDVYQALSASPRDRALFCVGISTGFRISELLSLRVSDVYQHGKVMDRVAVQRCNTKGKTQGRTSPLNATAQQAVSEWIAAMDNPTPDTFLFRSRKGDNKPITRQQAALVLREAYRTCEIPGSETAHQTGTHSLRKTAARRTLDACGNVLYVQRLLGHSSVATTMAYLSVDDDKLMQTMQQCDLPV